MNEEMIKALLEVAGKSETPAAIDGVLEVQKLMSDYSTMQTTLAAEREQSAQTEAKLRDELDRATRTMAKLIADVGIGKPAPEETTDPNEGYARFRASRM